MSIKGLAAILLASVLLSACVTPATQSPGPAPMIDSGNRAAVFCGEQGGRAEQVSTVDGRQVRYCMFPDGSSCEEWAYFRGQCRPGEFEHAPAVGNPASAFCTDWGGRLEMRADPDGGQIGYCLFADGSECEEWAFYRGQCTPAGETGTANPASIYCQDNGGQVEIRTAADGSQAGVCRFPDGSECEEWAFLRGDCMPVKTVVIRLNEKDNGGKIELQTGFVVEIKLQSDPASGQAWQVAQIPEAAVVQQLGESQLDSESGVETFRFAALASGQTALQLAYQPPGDSEAPPARTFEITLIVSP